MEFDAEPEFRLPSYHSLVVKVLQLSSGRHCNIPPPACQGAKRPVRKHRHMFALEPIQLFDFPASLRQAKPPSQAPPIIPEPPTLVKAIVAQSVFFKVWVISRSGPPMP